MNVLGIIGSPRRGGNTDLLVSRVLAGAREAGAATETVMLADLTIKECIGCHACWQGKECSRKDDMNGLYDVIAAADAFVFGTPVYWYGVTALMKGFIDRFVYFNCPANRPGVKGKQAVLVVPFEETDPDAAALLVDMFTRSMAYLEINLDPGAIILAPGVTRKGEVTACREAMEKAGRIGAGLAASH